MRKLTVTPGRRYLVRFSPKRVPHVFTDVLVIGGGIAGLRAALEVDPSLQTVVVSKDELNVSNSAWAQGGIAGVLDPLDDVVINHNLSDSTNDFVNSTSGELRLRSRWISSSPTFIYPWKIRVDHVRLDFK